MERKIWKEKFGDWFRDTIKRAEIIDYRYPIKGCGVWLNYGFKLRNKIIDIIREELDLSKHEEMLFPTLIPENLVSKESTHIKSFEQEAYWVTLGGRENLNVKLMLRPTSETAITPMVKLWVRSSADLPKKIYQICSIFRYETKATRPLIRVREVSTFKEAHTFHKSHDEGVHQLDEANQVYKRIFDKLCIPYLISERPEWDKFAGALTTYAFDTIFPDGKSLQIGTLHDLGQNFSKAFEFTIKQEDGNEEYVWQTSYGISERIIAAVIAIHGDDIGLIIPPKAAPIQVVIVPIPSKEEWGKIIEECQRVESILKNENIRVLIDLREDMTPGSKYYYWETHGIPLRIEIGPKDLKAESLTVVRRDNMKRSICEKSGISDYVKVIFSEIENNLKERSWNWLKDQIKRTENLMEAKSLAESSTGIIELPWCGKNDCGLELEKKINIRVLGIPKENITNSIRKCPICGENSKLILRIAKTY